MYNEVGCCICIGDQNEKIFDTINDEGFGSRIIVERDLLGKKRKGI